MAAYNKCLQDLKNWQSIAETSYGVHNLPERANGLSSRNVSVTNDTSYEEDLNNVTPVLTVEVFDHISVANNKPFEVLLEEKLQEENENINISTNTTSSSKPKKPFLKKGTGLNRFKQSGNTIPKKPILKKTTGLKTLKVAHKNPSKASISPKKPSLFTSFDLTPLKIPEASIKPRSPLTETIHDVVNSPTKILRKSPRFEDYQSSYAEGDGVGVFEWLPPSLEVEEARLDSVKKMDIMSRINEFAKRKLGIGGRKSPNTSPTKHEITEAQETLIFEQLENLADNSSFCSTNSSVLRILSSTPRSNRFTNLTEKTTPTNQTGTTPKGKMELESKLKLLDEKTEVLNNFISKLKLIKGNETDESTRADLDSEDIWSNTGGSTSYSSSPEQYTNTNSPKMKEMYANTSFNSTLNQNCSECDRKSNELSKKNATIKKLKEENDRANDYIRNIRMEREELNRKIRKIEEDFHEEKANLMEDVEDLHKKLQREKQIFESYKKNVHNIRKDQDDLTHLKQELIETKELLKLKETKNATTTARLRSQLKILEKENGDLKTQVEKLNRDNARLKANQNLSRRPSETKMLSEINKNIAKLTEEKEKKDQKIIESNTAQNSCTPTSSVTEKKLTRTEKKETINTPRKVNFSQENTSDELTAMESTVFGNLSIEKQYENVFGKLPAQNSSLNESKKEKIETILPDGSRQIKYSNGNVKTISADGANVVVKYYNGDIKETDLIKNIEKYFYSFNNTWHTTFDDGTEYVEFPTGQLEKKYADGRVEVFYADGVTQTVFKDKSQEVKYTDGSVLNIDANGLRLLVLANGQREIHTETEKRREYPDGTVKILYPDGSQESRYSNGRIRKKDHMGNLILDTRIDY